MTNQPWCMLISTLLNYTESLLERNKERKPQMTKKPKRGRAWKCTWSRIWRQTKLIRLISRTWKEFWKVKVWLREFNIEKLSKVVLLERGLPLPKEKSSRRRISWLSTLLTSPKMMSLVLTACTTLSVKPPALYKLWSWIKGKVREEYDVKLLMLRLKPDMTIMNLMRWFHSKMENRRSS